MMASEEDLRMEEGILKHISDNLNKMCPTGWLLQRKRGWEKVFQKITVTLRLS
mgnify:CR=1 FL=1